jgi:WD40 repeat protein
LATTSDDQMTRVWDLASGELERTLVGQDGTITSAWFSNDGERIATGSSTLGARVWDLSNARAGEVAGIDLGADFRQIIDVDHHGSIVAVLGRPCAVLCLGEVAVVDLVSGQRMAVHEQGGAAVAVAPDGSGVFSQAGFMPEGHFATGPIRKYRLWSGEPAFELEGICPLAIRGGDGCGEAPDVPWDDQASSFAFSPDGSTLAMRGFLTLASWKAATGDLLNVTADFTTAGPAFNPNGSIIATSNGEETVVTLDPATLHANATVLQLDEVGRLQFSPDGSALGVVSAKFETRIHDASSWEVGRVLPVQSHDLDFDSTGRILATADADGSIRLWDVRSGDERQTIPVDRTGIGYRLGRVAFLDDERHLLTVDANSILVMTSDVGELLEIGRSRLTRGFTAAECLKYPVEGCPAP